MTRFTRKISTKIFSDLKLTVFQWNETLAFSNHPKTVKKANWSNFHLRLCACAFSDRTKTFYRGGGRRRYFLFRKIFICRRFRDDESVLKTELGLIVNCLVRLSSGSVPLSVLFRWFSWFCTVSKFTAEMKELFNGNLSIEQNGSEVFY